VTVKELITALLDCPMNYTVDVNFNRAHLPADPAAALRWDGGDYRVEDVARVLSKSLEPGGWVTLDVEEAQ
jgi:hypothetical protein